MVESPEREGETASAIAEEGDLDADCDTGEEPAAELGPEAHENESDTREDLYLVHWPDAMVTVCRAKDEESLWSSMSKLGDVSACRCVKYDGPFQINLKVAPTPGTTTPAAQDACVAHTAL